MERAANMQSQHDTRTEAALYWTAVSLIVCEGLSIEKAAERLSVDAEDLTDILHRRQSLRPNAPVNPRGSPAVSTHS
jgi:hypothetical protein